MERDGEVLHPRRAARAPHETRFPEHEPGLLLAEEQASIIADACPP